MQCSTCRWCDMLTDTDVDNRTIFTFHDCHRYPPVSGEWPAMNPTDWCGEWTPQWDMTERPDVTRADQAKRTEEDSDV